MSRDDPPIPARPSPGQEARTGEARTGTQQDAASSDAPAASLPKPRHEAFCQHFVLLGNASYAAVDAGYARPSSRNQGYRLMRRPAIRTRIAEIRRVLGRAYCLDAEVLLGKLEAIYQRANENHFFHAAARAVELQARIAGNVHSRGEERSPRKRTGVRDRDQTRDPLAANTTTNDDSYAPAAAQNTGPSTPRPAAGAQK